MKYAIGRKDGGVSIMNILGDSKPEDEIAKWPVSLQAEVVSILAIPETSVPLDRTYRQAWAQCHQNGVKVDMVKAKSIHKDLMRAARLSKLAALDVEQLRGRDVEAQKQLLRDVTSDPRIESAQTTEELKAVWPECLK